jgi:hypothetical protein
MIERNRKPIWNLIIVIHVSSCMGEGDVKLRENDRMEEESKRNLIIGPHAGS